MLPQNSENNSNYIYVYASICLTTYTTLNVFIKQIPFKWQINGKGI